MFSRRVENPLDRQIDRALRDMNNHTIGSEEYLAHLSAVTELTKLKKEQRSLAVSKDTLAVVAGNLLGIVMVIKHESLNVVTSKAIGLLLRPR